MHVRVHNVCVCVFCVFLVCAVVCWCCVLCVVCKRVCLSRCRPFARVLFINWMDLFFGFTPITFGLVLLRDVVFVAVRSDTLWFVCFVLFVFSSISPFLYFSVFDVFRFLISRFLDLLDILVFCQNTIGAMCLV